MLEEHDKQSNATKEEHERAITLLEQRHQALRQKLFFFLFVVFFCYNFFFFLFFRYTEVDELYRKRPSREEDIERIQGLEARLADQGAIVAKLQAY